MTLRIAVPNKGRLETPAAELLHHAGLRFEKTARSLSVAARNEDVELLFVRTEDVAEMVSDGVAQLGITGIDLLAESAAALEVRAHLGFGRCRLVAAVPNSSALVDIGGLAGLRIATAHTRITTEFFAAKGIPVTVIPLHGSVEVAPKLGVADAVVDLVSSGSTMLINGLRPIATLLDSEAVIVSRAAASPDPGVNRVITMLTSVVAGRRRKYLLMNAPREALAAIEQIIPGVDAPSVVPLAHNGKVAIHSVVDADDVWSVLPRLEAAGATGILVLPIEQMIS